MFDIKVENLSFAYKDKQILNDVNLEVKSGEFVCILGPSGCGKSTLLRLIAGLEKPDKGRVLLNDKKVTGPGLDRGVVFQDYSLFSWMTTGENIELAVEQAFKGMSKDEKEKISREYLDIVGLGDEYDKLPGNLSGGMRQRAAIARAFAINPPVLLMDEPFGALDAVTRNRLQELTLSLWERDKESKKTILFVTHDVDEALKISQKMFIMSASKEEESKIIEIDENEKRDRDNIYGNPYFLELKNTLIELLHL